MTVPTQDEIAEFTRVQYEYWNEGKWPELLDAYTRIAPNGFTIQYHGKEPLEGRLALEAMIRRLGGRVRTIVEKVLVSEGESVSVVSNEIVGTDVASTSVERHRFADGRLECSYFHDTAEAELMVRTLGAAK